MVKVRVRNDTDINVRIQEGNAGVYVSRAVLKPATSFNLDLDPNATYREYVFLKLPDNQRLDPMFSSDDVAEFKEILVQMKVDTHPAEYYWEGISRAEKSVTGDKKLKLPCTDPTSTIQTGGLFQWVKNLFSRNSS